MSVSPPRPKGPPLNALRAFESAARLGSFVAAADELCVTPGAVSQHIKTVEGWAGTPLFRRNRQGVVLTPAGQALLPRFTEAFDQMGQAVRALRDLRPTRDIHIATMPSLAQLWLPKRLLAFREAHPDVNVSVTALETPPNLQRDLFDLSLFLQKPGDGTAIALDRMTPVCAPSLAAGIRGLEDLARHRLLVDQSWDGDWDLWFQALGSGVPGGVRRTSYSLYSLALEEAKAGAGILMGHELLVRQALESGALVQPFADWLPSGLALALDRAGQARDADLQALVRVLSRG